MSVGTASDFQTTQPGMAGEGNPDMNPASEPGMPMDGADSALTDQYSDASLPEDAAEGLVFSDDDLAFLRSEEVRQWFAENKPSGFHTEEEFQRHKANLQQTLSSQFEAEKRRQAQEFQGQLSERESQLATLVNALYTAWDEMGIERNSQDWQQREAQITQLVRTQANERKLQQVESQQQRSAGMVQEVGRFNADLDFVGLGDEQAKAFAQPYLRQHIVNMQNGTYTDAAHAEQGRRYYIQQAQQAYRQSQQQATPPATAPQQQPPTQQTQQRQRPNPGPLRSVQGRGGSTPRSMNDIYQERFAALVKDKGGAAHVTADEIDQLWVEAAIAAG